MIFQHFLFKSVRSMAMVEYTDEICMQFHGGTYIVIFIWIGDPMLRVSLFKQDNMILSDIDSSAFEYFKYKFNGHFHEPSNLLKFYSKVECNQYWSYICTIYTLTRHLALWSFSTLHQLPVIASLYFNVRLPQNELSCVRNYLEIDFE